MENKIKTLHEEIRYAGTMQPEVQALLDLEVVDSYSNSNYDKRLFILEDGQVVLKQERFVEIVGTMNFAAIGVKVPDWEDPAEIELEEVKEIEEVDVE